MGKLNSVLLVKMGTEWKMVDVWIMGETCNLNDSTNSIINYKMIILNRKCSSVRINNSQNVRRILNCSVS